MKTDVENLSTTRVRITVGIPFEEIADDLRQAYRSIAQQVNIPGFRKGKVPPRIIDQRFGRATVLTEVANTVIPRTYESVIRAQALVPLGQPEVEVTKLEDGDLLEFTAEVDVRPEFELPPVEGLQIEVDAVEVTEDSVEQELLALRKRFATYTDVDRPAKAGDVVVVDTRAVDPDGAVVEGFTASGLTYEVGSGDAIPGFDEAVAGATAEESRTFNHTPEGGQELSIEVTVRKVRQQDLPEADDEFAMMASEFDTIEELLADLREKQRRLALFKQGSDARAKVREAYLAQIEFDLPEGLIQSQLQEHFADGHGDDEHRAATEAEMRENLKANLVLDKLAEEHDLKVEQNELNHWLITQAARYGMSPDQFANTLVQSGQVELAIGEVRRAKALSLIVEGATITDTNGEPVDLEKIAQQLSGGAGEE